MKQIFICLFVVLSLCACGHSNSSAPSNADRSTVVQSLVPRLQVVSIDPRPVLQPGPATSWDGADVLNPAVVSFKGALYNHYSGYAAGHWDTGTAISTDGGKTWKKNPSPFLVAPSVSDAVPEPIAANSASIVFHGKLLHYYERTRSPADSRVSIWLACSSDGIRWDTSAGEVFAASGKSGSFDEDQVADPFVVLVNGKLYLYYTGVPTGQFRVLLGVATSEDGVHWVRAGGPLIPQGQPGMFDEFIQGEPTVVYTGKFWYMLFVGDTNQGYRSIGWASSPDGIHWKQQSTTESIVPPALRQSWFAEMMIDPDIVQDPNPDGTYTVYFGGGLRPGNQLISGQIGRMRIKLD